MNGSLLPSGPCSAMTTASIRWLFNPNLTQASDAVPPGQLHHLWMAAPRPARTSGDRPASAVKANPVRAQEQRVLGGGLCPCCCLGRPWRASRWVPRGCWAHEGVNPQQMGWGHVDTARLAWQVSAADVLHLFLTHTCLTATNISHAHHHSRSSSMAPKHCKHLRWVRQTGTSCAVRPSAGS